MNPLFEKEITWCIDNCKKNKDCRIIDCDGIALLTCDEDNRAIIRPVDYENKGLGKEG